MSDIDEDQAQLVADCEARESRMNDWEKDFIADVSPRLDRGDSLAPGTAAKLNQIWDKVTEAG